MRRKGTKVCSVYTWPKGNNILQDSLHPTLLTHRNPWVLLGYFSFICKLYPSLKSYLSDVDNQLAINYGDLSKSSSVNFLMQ